MYSNIPHSAGTCDYDYVKSRFVLAANALKLLDVASLLSSFALKMEALLECERSRLRHQDLTESWRQGYNPLVFVDGTLVGGGHSAALLEQLQPGDILLGCDVDPNALKAASQRLASYMDHDGMTKPHFIPVQSNFGDLTKTLPSILHPVTQNPVLPLNAMDGTSGVDGLLLDLGVSSHQIDTPERGFAFMKDGPLDMRMGTSWMVMSYSGFLRFMETSQQGPRLLQSLIIDLCVLLKIL